jgi:sulfate adenylyltransferase
MTEPWRGTVVFFTGLSGAGKSTIANELVRLLRAEGEPDVALLDGDEIRRHLSADLGFDAASRERNVERVARVAAGIAERGGIAITALIAPFEAARARAREIADAADVRFLLVYIRTPLEVVEARDVKGLYRRARAGEIADFTGITSPFEEPGAPDVVIETATTSPAEAAAQIRAALRARRQAGEPSPGG